MIRMGFSVVCMVCAMTLQPLAAIGAPLQDATIDKAIEGDAQAQAAVAGAELADVERVETRLRPLVFPPAKELRASINRLGDADPAVRERETAALRRISRAALPMLRSALAEEEDPEVRLRLTSVVEGLGRSKSVCVADQLLRGLYARHGSELIAGRLKLLSDDCLDWRALTFCRLSSFATTWGVVQTRPEEEQLRFILARIYTERASAEVAELLGKYRGTALLKMAERTYWPVELQPPLRDGAYLWGMRAASLKGNVGECVLQISIEPGEHGGRWVHFNVWERLYYLWRNEKPYLGSYEGMAFGVNRAAYGSLHPGVDQGYTRPLHVNRLPPDLKLAVVRMSDAEQQDWTVGRMYDWAKELFPMEYRAKLKFEPGRRSPAAVIVQSPGG